MILAIYLLTILFGVSGLLWRELISQYLRRKPFLQLDESPRAQWNTIPELSVGLIALLWLSSHLLSNFSAKPRTLPEDVDLKLVLIQAFVNFGLSLFLPLILLTSQNSLSRFGIRISDWRDQLWTGVLAFFVSVIPMAAAMVATISFRPPEAQNSLLKLLTNSPNTETVVVVIVTAVISAPLAEELIFRVVLQGWLTTVFPPRVAIPLVAISFGLVHGWRDGLALLPLALILGYVFHRRHSYVAVVMIHSLFNATMLTLQLVTPQTS